jgi:hypothetical protein
MCNCAEGFSGEDCSIGSKIQSSEESQSSVIGIMTPVRRKHDKYSICPFAHVFVLKLVMQLVLLEVLVELFY